MRRSTLAAVLVAVLVVGYSSIAAAQQTKWYIGGAAGQTTFRGACDDVPVRCDDTDGSLKVFGGYQINQKFAAELGYVDFGKANASGTIGGVAVSATGKSSAWELVGVGSIPLAQNFGLYGKLGLYGARTKVHATAAIANFSVTQSESVSNTGLTLGGGLAYDFTRNLAARAEWQRYNSVGGGDIGKSDVDVLSLGLLFRF